MAIGKASDFKIYEEQFYGGWTEAIEQNTNAFNAASNNCLVLTSKFVKGNYEQESFNQLIAGLVSRRDTTSVSAATDLAITQGEIARVKLNRKIGPVAQTLDALRKIGKTDQEVSFVLGGQMALAVLAEQLNTALSAARVAGKTNTDVYYDGTAGTLSHATLVAGLQKFGDASQRIQCFVMHSKSYFNLISNALTDKIVEVAGATIYTGTVATFGRPVVVTDSSSLVVAGTPDQYFVLGLVPGGIQVEESEDRQVVSQMVTGLENLVVRIQGEYAYNLGLKGYTWDISHGGANPLAAAVATGSNWDVVATDLRSTFGVCIEVD